MFVAMIFLLSFLSSANAVQEVDELREHQFIVLNLRNVSTGQVNWFVVNNPDRRDMFLSMQLIPIPMYENCYFYREQCNSTFWDTSFEILYNGNKVIADTTSCWNWWNTSSNPSTLLMEREENKTLCPLVSIPYSPIDTDFNITFNMTPSESGKALPHLNVRVFTYSTAFSDKTFTYSPTADRSIIALGDLLTININIWRLIYYDLIIALVIIGALLIVGGIPILIKWIIDKAGGK